jgi:hypothetical protein
MGWPGSRRDSRESEMFAFWQDRMAMHTEEALAALLACRAWLRTYTVKQKSLNKQLDSEKLRNIATARIGAVDHGVLIAALDLERFTIQQVTVFGQPRARAWANIRLLAAAYRLGGSR